MIIKHSALAQQLLVKHYACYVVVGNDPYLVEDTIIQLKNAWDKQGESETIKIELDTPEDWEFLLAETKMGSLFTDRRLIDAKLNKKTIDQAKKIQLQTYLHSDLSSNDVLLLRAPEVPIKSIGWLSDDPRVLVVHVTPLTSHELIQWIRKQLREKNMRYTDDIPEWIHHYTQGNMLACAQWIERLSLLYTNNQINRSVLESQPIDQSQFQVFDLVDACLSSNMTRVLQIMRFLQQDRAEPSLLLWLLSKEIRLLLQLHQARIAGRTIQQAAKELQIWSSRLKLYEKSMQRLSINKLSLLIDHCQRIDKSIKSHQNKLIWTEIERVALNITQEFTL